MRREIADEGTVFAVRARRTALALPLVLVAWFSGVSSPWACEELFAQRVKERVPPGLWGSRYLTAIGDFDGDGCVDRAFFLPAAGTVPLIVCHGDGQRMTTLLELGSIETLAEQGIASVRRGTHPSLCGKGYGPDCGPGEPATITLDHEAIQFLYLERSSYLLYWQDGEWNKIWWSD